MAQANTVDIVKRYNENLIRQFNISSIIEHYDLNTDDLAKVLFPHVKYPKQAFDRVLKSETELDMKQLELLASYIGILVSDLFSFELWKGGTENGMLIFTKGEYTAKLTYNGSFLTIYKNNIFIKQIINAPSMTVLEFINYLNNLIKSYENGND